MISFLVTVLLLLGNAFFVASEFSLIASRPTVIEPMAETSRRARTALRAMSQIPIMIAGAQLGVTVCSLGLGALAEPALAHLLEPPFAAVGLPADVAHPVAFVLGLGVVVFAHTVIGEMVPKNLTLAGPEKAVMWLGPPMLAFCMATKPLLVAMKWAARAILSLWRVPATDAVKTVFTAEELAGLAAEATSEGLLAPEEHARITGALALSRRTAQDAMRPWSEITTVASDVSPASLEVLATRTNRSRFPVVDRASRRVLGFVHVKDVLAIVGPQRRAPIPPELIRPLAIVPPTRTLAELLLAMRRERRHIVLVSDGRSPVGVVTLDDVLTAVVGFDRPVPAEVGQTA
jgi:CBS domain containing-hemolysin-like protein